MFLRLPLAKLGWAYFVLQIMLCFWEISGISVTYLSALVINSCLTGFYTYQNNPIAWRAIKTENDRMLLIAKEAICELPYNNEIKDITWQNSSLFSWLNNDFRGSFSKDQLSNISTTKVDGADCKVFLLSKEEAENLKDTSVLTAKTDWWLRTKSDVNALYVKSSGEIVEDGETVVRAKGVRP